MKDQNVYGLVGTGLWFVLIVGAWLLAQLFVFGIYFDIATAPSGGEVTLTPEEAEAAILALANNGTALGMATVVSGVVGLLFVFLAIKLKKGYSISNYLGAKKVGLADFFKWCAVLLVVLVASEIAIYLAGKESVPELMSEIYLSADPKWLLWVAVVLVAPIFEEVFFRGFLFEGLKNSILGVAGAIIITAAIWASVHGQYEPYYIAIIFCLGVVFGYIKQRTGDIFTLIVLHALVNLLATLQVAFF